jgi:hypothetical protein
MLVHRADRRRRMRIMFAAVTSALGPGLVAATVFAVAWRVSGGTTLGVAVGVSVFVPAIFGFAKGLSRRDLLAAASELDRRSGLEAALATGVEVVTGRIAGALSGAALAEAELVAARTTHEAVPIAPRRARYLALPATVLVGILLVPGGAAQRAGRFIFVPGGDTADARTGDATTLSADEVTEDRARAAERNSEALAKHPDGTERDPGAEAAVLPPPPQRTHTRRSRSGLSRAAGALDLESKDASGTGAPDAEAAASQIGRGTGEAVDLGESGLMLKRFPEYEDLVRRYFAGPTGG